MLTAESGGLEEISAEGGTASNGSIMINGTSPGDLHSYRVNVSNGNSNYFMEWAAAVLGVSSSHAVNQGSNHYLYLGNLTGGSITPTQTEFLSARSASAEIWRIDWLAGGGASKFLQLYDANGTLIATSTEDFPTDFSDFYWEVIWTNDNSTVFKLWINNTLIFDETGFDAYNGNDLVSYKSMSTNGPSAGTHSNFLGDIFCGNGVEADRFGDTAFNIISYQNGETYSESDPDQGTWAEARDQASVEEADGTAAEFDTGTNTGNVTCDDFSNSRGQAGGPAGGRTPSPLFGTIVALKWCYNMKRSNGSDAQVSLHRPHDDHTGDERIDINSILSTSYAGVNAMDGDVATLLSDFDVTTTHGMIGMGRYANGGRDINMADGWFMVGYLEAAAAANAPPLPHPSTVQPRRHLLRR